MRQISRVSILVHFVLLPLGVLTIRHGSDNEEEQTQSHRAIVVEALNFEADHSNASQSLQSGQDRAIVELQSFQNKETNEDNAIVNSSDRPTLKEAEALKMKKPMLGSAAGMAAIEKEAKRNKKKREAKLAGLPPPQLKEVFVPKQTQVVRVMSLEEFGRMLKTHTAGGQYFKDNNMKFLIQKAIDLTKLSDEEKRKYEKANGAFNLTSTAFVDAKTTQLGRESQSADMYERTKLADFQKFMGKAYSIPAVAKRELIEGVAPLGSLTLKLRGVKVGFEVPRRFALRTGSETEAKKPIFVMCGAPITKLLSVENSEGMKDDDFKNMMIWLRKDGWLGRELEVTWRVR